MMAKREKSGKEETGRKQKSQAGVSGYVGE